MKSPASTYRVQLSPDFTLWNFENIMNYLDELGVSSIYAAPFFQARKGSTHGYDIADPSHINREIGTLESFRKIASELKLKKMGWLQDIVPNHMVFGGENVWMRQILELGPDSRYYKYFDIDWNADGEEKLMAPFLGAPLEEILENEELKVNFDERGFSLNYYDNSYPASARSYAEILDDSKLEEWKKKFREFEGDPKKWQKLKDVFHWDTCRHSECSNELENTLNKINKDSEKLKRILDLQYFLPAHWKKTEKEINYRRFFTINDLICLKMEDPKVFEEYHSYIKELCQEGLVEGLRIDHIDGLFDPKKYLELLRKMMGPEFFIIAEKILEAEEKLPLDWPVQGTSGYEFLAKVNQLFTDRKGEKKFTEFYKKIYPELPDFDQLVYNKKLFILKERMGGELQNLWVLLNQLELLPQKESKNEEKWKRALASIMAAFPVYRIYPSRFPLTKEQKEVIETACSYALQQEKESKTQIDYLEALFLGDADKENGKMLHFLKRCQQFTGPLAAKGVEDTSFYVYNRHIAHNEVGDSPKKFGSNVEEFHRQMQWRQKHFPMSINATATHDTKRGEDARMRLNVLSEIAEEWTEKVSDWQKINQKIRKEERKGPDANEEYFIYQAILGAMPFDLKDDKKFFERTQEYLQKVMREAKVNSSWAEPDVDYEKAVFSFTEDILKNKEFRKSFDEICQKSHYYGVLKSLGQCVMKATAPGIPDTYQGSELWDLNYVDPDNRRPVDFELRKRYLREFQSWDNKNLPKKLKALLSDYQDARVKMFVLHKLLKERRKNKDVFEKGEYLPLKISGGDKEEMICFARNYQKQWYLILVPILVTKIFEEKEFQPNRDHLKERKLELPKNVPGKWNNVFSGQNIKSEDLSPADLLRDFPVVVLTGQN